MVSSNDVHVSMTLEEDDQEAAAAADHIQLSSENMHHHRISNQRRAVRIDEFCRFGFPLGFIIFNVCYWNYYQSADDVEAEHGL